MIIFIGMRARVPVLKMKLKNPLNKHISLINFAHCSDVSRIQCKQDVPLFSVKGVRIIRNILVFTINAKKLLSFIFFLLHEAA